MFDILFFNTDDEEKKIYKEAFSSRYNISCVPFSLDENVTITESMKEVKIISCFTLSKLDEKILKNFPSLKLIVLRCVGFNNVDIKYCKRKNIKVVNAFGYGNRSVAEFTFGLMLDVSRNISKSYYQLKEDKKHKQVNIGYDLFEKTIGVIGTGAIGEEIVKIANKGFNMNVLAFDLIQKKNLIDEYNVKYTTLDNLLINSDFITLHIPLTKENYHIIDENKIKLMKETAIIINTARGELIDTKALFKALNFETIAGAGLDVLECEKESTSFEFIHDMDYMEKEKIKNVLLNNEILKLNNVVITPHIAYDTKEAKKKIRRITIDNINSFFNGKIQNSVY